MGTKNESDAEAQSSTSEDTDGPESNESSIESDINLVDDIKRITCLDNIKQSIPLSIFDVDFQYYHRQYIYKKQSKNHYIKIAIDDEPNHLSYMSFTKFIHFMFMKKEKTKKEVKINPFLPNLDDLLEFL